MDCLKPLLTPDHPNTILAEFKCLRLTDETIYLRRVSINLVKGMVGMTFSCDGSHYIDHKTLFKELETFGRPP